MKWANKLESTLSRFAFTPASPVPLEILRILVSAVLLAQAFLVAPDFFELYGSQGIFQGPLQVFFSNDTAPGVVSVVRWLGPLGLTEKQSLGLVGVLYVTGLSFLLLGIATRTAAVLTWFTHLLLVGTHFTSYGVDQFAHFLLFYFTWMPVGGSGRPSALAGFSIRMLQLHLCLVYFSSGIDKSFGDQWWSGEAIWRALSMPIYVQADMSWISSMPFVAKLTAWGTLLVEIGYPLFIWMPKTKMLWVVTTIAMHAGIGIFMGLHTFSFLMASLTFSMFGISSLAKETTEYKFPTQLRAIIS